jgi:hypothetical protein
MPEQPPDGGPLARLETVRARECRGERLRGQVRRHLGIADATKEVAQQPRLVAVIEDTERARLATRSVEQLLIRGAVPDGAHIHTLPCTRGL